MICNLHSATMLQVQPLHAEIYLGFRDMKAFQTSDVFHSFAVFEGVTFDPPVLPNFASDLSVYHQMADSRQEAIMGEKTGFANPSHPTCNLPQMLGLSDWLSLNKSSKCLDVPSPPLVVSLHDFDVLIIISIHVRSLLFHSYSAFCTRSSLGPGNSSIASLKIGSQAVSGICIGCQEGKQPSLSPGKQDHQPEAAKHKSLMGGLASEGMPILLPDINDGGWVQIGKASENIPQIARDQQDKADTASQSLETQQRAPSLGTTNKSLPSDRHEHR